MALVLLTRWSLLPYYCRQPARAVWGGNLGGHPVQGRGGDQAEGRGFADVGGDTRFIRAGERDAAELLLEQVPEQAVADTAATKENTIDPRGRRQEAFQSGGD